MRTHFSSLFCVTSHSLTKSGVRESSKAKVGAADKVSAAATAARADTKGKGTPDNLGKLLELHVKYVLLKCFACMHAYIHLKKCKI